MADKKISELVSITGANTAGDDYFVVVDTSGAVTYKISREELNNAIEQDVLSSIEITDITNDVNVQGTVTADGLTVSTSGTNSEAYFDNGSKSYRLLNRSSDNSFSIFDNTASAFRLTTASNGDISFYEDTGVTQGFFWDASAESLGIGTTSPSAGAVGGTVVHVQKSGGTASVRVDRSDASTAGTLSMTSGDTTNGFYGTGAKPMVFSTNATERMRITSTGELLVGTTSDTMPAAAAAGQGIMAGTRTFIATETGGDTILGGTTGSNFTAFYQGGTERMRIDSIGSLVVGGTGSGANNATTLYATGLVISRSSDTGGVIILDRDVGLDGTIIDFRRQNTVVGSIVADAGDLTIGTGNTGLRFYNGGLAIIPRNTNRSTSDNVLDLGSSGNRFDDIYATNGTIQTSDANEKQQIAALTDAEITAAKAISALFKTFKWNDAVAEKGDAARTHAGVIAQDVQAAMTAAGLDASDYAFFISSTWYVDADGNEVEADAEGAIEKNRKGIRYPELLAFVGAATEQRLANIETRLAALEAN